MLTSEETFLFKTLKKKTLTLIQLLIGFVFLLVVEDVIL